MEALKYECAIILCCPLVASDNITSHGLAPGMEPEYTHWDWLQTSKLIRTLICSPLPMDEVLKWSLLMQRVRRPGQKENGWCCCYQQAPLLQRMYTVCTFSAVMFVYTSNADQFLWLLKFTYHGTNGVTALVWYVYIAICVPVCMLVYIYMYQVQRNGNVGCLWLEIPPLIIDSENI